MVMLVDPKTYAAMEDVVRERIRQRAEEGYDDAHDDAHEEHQLARAAACYAVCDERRQIRSLMLYNHVIWPWNPDFWKPSTYRRNLVKAGALILAEIERIDRKSSQP